MVDLNTLRFTKTHEWAKQENKRVRVGITDYAQKEITDVVFIELPPLGKEVKQDDECMIVESVKSVFTIYSPVSGKVVAVNKTTETDPVLLNKSPYEQGWLFVIECSSPEEIQNLLTYEQYQEFIKK